MVLKACCGCIERRTGCFIIGYLFLAYYILAAVMSFRLVKEVPDKSENLDSDNKKLFTTIMAVVLGIVLVNILFIIILLVGLHKKKPNCLKAFLIFECIFVVIAFILFIARMVKCKERYGIAIDILIQIMDYLLTIYFLLVIKSEYLSIKFPNINNSPVAYKPASINVYAPAAYNPPSNNGYAPVAYTPASNNGYAPAAYNPASNHGFAPVAYNPSSNHGYVPVAYNSASNSNNGPAVHNVSAV